MASEGWIKLRNGVWRQPLAQNEELGFQMDLIRVKADFADSPHVHDGFEWVYILEGGFMDDRGWHKKGEFIVNKTEGVHQILTGPDGCLLLIVWTGSVSGV